MARLLGGAQEAAQEPLVKVDLGPLREQAGQISCNRDDVAKRRLRLRGIHVQRLGARGPGAVFAGNLFDVALTDRALGEVLHQRGVVAAGACKEQIAQARPVRASPVRHGQVVHVASLPVRKGDRTPYFLGQVKGPVPFFGQALTVLRASESVPATAAARGSWPCTRRPRTCSAPRRSAGKAWLRPRFARTLARSSP